MGLSLEILNAEGEPLATCSEADDAAVAIMAADGKGTIRTTKTKTVLWKTGDGEEIASIVSGKVKAIDAKTRAAADALAKKENAKREAAAKKDAKKKAKSKR